MKGLLVGLTINSWFSYLVNLGLVSKHIGSKWTQQLKDLLPITVVSVLAAVVSFLVGYFVKGNMYLNGLLMLVVYLVIYVGWSVVFKPESYTYFLTIIPAKLRFWERKKQKE